MSDRIPLPSHISEATRRLNPHLFTQGAAGPTVAELCKGAAKAQEALHSNLKGTPRQPNKTEQRFLDRCEAMKRRGEIDSYRFEGMRLKWGDCMFYKPDMVIFTGAKITLIEIKGPHIKGKDAIRFKGCRAEWPEFEFEMWQEVKREWKRIL
jgi:hypothetical protein